MVQDTKLKILITGATSGIGSYMARYLSQRGHSVILHGRDEAKLSALASVLETPPLLDVVADLADSKQVAMMFSRISNKTESVDVLINNAFGKLEVELCETTGEALMEFFGVSVAGTANVTREAVPLLIKAKSGRIINIVADWGFPMHNVMTGPSAYIAAKYGVHGLGVALQTELAKVGLRTTNICPGVVAAQTEFGQVEEDYNDGEPLKAIHPIDVARAVDFVISQEFCHVRSLVLTPRNPEYNGL